MLQCAVLGPVMTAVMGSPAVGEYSVMRFPWGGRGVGLEGAQWDRKAMVRLDKFSDKYAI